MSGMPLFDYDAPAELYVNKGARRQRSMTFKRFDRAAEAVRYVTEELPLPNAASAVIEINETRYRHPEILGLYNAAEYPLPRR